MVKRRSSLMLNPLEVTASGRELSFTNLATSDRHSVLSGPSQTAAWVDLSEVGSTFSHEGSSLYLRLGAIGRVARAALNTRWRRYLC